MFADAENTNSSSSTEQKEWGYDLYPERRGQKYSPSLKKIILGIEGRESTDKLKCEKNVFACIKKSKKKYFTINVIFNNRTETYFFKVLS